MDIIKPIFAFSFVCLIAAAAPIWHINSALAAQMYSVDANSTTLVNEWNECRRVSNAPGFATVFIPTNTAAEWTEFRLHYPSNVTLSNGCYHRRPITVTNSTGGALSDFQVSFTLDTASIISAGKMNSDCSNISVTDSDGATNLGYWVMSGCNTGATKIWTKIPYLNAGTKTIYFNYGIGLVNNSNAENVFLYGNPDFEVDAVNTAYSAISYWDWREGRTSWADGTWTVTDWGNTVCGKNGDIRSTRRFSGAKAYYSYVQSCDDWSAEDDRFAVTELYTSPSYRAVALDNFVRIRMLFYAVVKPTVPPRWSWRTVLRISDPSNAQYSILRCDSWGQNEGCVPQNNYESTAVGADGYTWHVYRVNIPANYDRSDLWLAIRHWEDTWDNTTGSSTFFFDSLENIRLRKYASPDPTTSVGSEQ